MKRDELLGLEVDWRPRSDGVQVITLRDLIAEAGHALVPLEPTEAMSDAGSAAFHGLSHKQAQPVAASQCNSVYKAMIEASDA